jgi:phage tail sheath protein FI
MPQYLSPGVYVEEIPSAVQAIAGVGTSTAGFIGKAPDTVRVPLSSTYVTNEMIGVGDGAVTRFVLKKYPVNTAEDTFEMRVDGVVTAATLANDDAASQASVTFTDPPAAGAKIMGDYVGNLSIQVFSLPAKPGDVKLCTNFAEFKRNFGDFSIESPDHSNLAHAVFGFFHNGGTRCYVVRITSDAELDRTLEKLGAVDEIAIVAAPGLTGGAANATTRDKLVTHCKVATQDRFAIFDSPEKLEDANGFLDLTQLDPSNAGNVLPDNSDYAALYFPWIQVFDPASKIMAPRSESRIYVPPSGHVAGVYARVDTNRGVHKAPANEPVMGALDLRYKISKAQQDGLNPQGVNCIRDLNGNIRVWGARTIGGDANGEWRYINVRRTFLFLRESIDEGMQWAVFEPNDANLWAKITRNVSAFLTNVWRSGALFGATPQEAFYVKCDAETNPPELREIGQVVTEIGVAVVRPAEFVIFRISQWQPQPS